ncbi:sulfite exporter TauE/SafE family protein [Flavobacterium sp.]|uniref:sulfite exporter TauE/SafE family protein n=1 Tax=Flavobacterium sp. TaxID=239 RepID=UPI00286CFEFC|nr:sulfite exporter TauE/SafE family protein [Flavobacterium sp.]
MDYFIICIVALLGSALTLFSGFGLGTLLLPVFALFFPIEVAIIMTSIVHFSNNIIKLLFFGKQIDKNVVLKFGIPAIIFAFLGAYILKLLSSMQPIFEYSFSGKTFQVMLIKIIIGVLLIVFSLIEFIPRFKNLEFNQKYLSVGGALSGFFGGLSGHQGALRSAFLIKAHLPKEVFIATGVCIACLVDISRLSIYIPEIIYKGTILNYSLIISATVSAFLGVYFGNKLLQKITITTIQNIVAVLLFVFGGLLIFGII